MNDPLRGMAAVAVAASTTLTAADAVVFGVALGIRLADTDKALAVEAWEVASAILDDSEKGTFTADLDTVIENLRKA